jgi:hypothetical protein
MAGLGKNNIDHRRLNCHLNVGYGARLTRWEF